MAAKRMAAALISTVHRSQFGTVQEAMVHRPGSAPLLLVPPVGEPELSLPLIEPNRTKPSADSLWQHYFEHPSHWWDNRKNKLHPRSPDFRHKSTNLALWVEHWNTPKWVTGALPKNVVSMKAGGGNCEIGSTFDGVSRQYNGVVDLKLSKHAEFFWTALIAQHTKCGRGRQALRVYQEMRKRAVEPSSHTFVALLKACSILQDLESAKEIHAELVRSGLESDLYVGTTLVDVYAKCRSLVDARAAFEKMARRDVVAWNSMILGYVQMEKNEEALQLYTQMQQEGVVPHDRTYVSALKACSAIAESVGTRDGDGIADNERCLETVRSIHRDIVKGKFESGLFVGTMLVDAYAKCGSLEDARQVFEKMPCRDVASWNSIILGYAQMNKGEEGLQLFTRMRHEGLLPDSRTYVSALKACGSLAELGQRDGGDGRAPAAKECLETVKAFHMDIVRQKFEFDLFVGTTLVDVYAKCRSLEDARRVFDLMPDRTVVTWNAMILGYVQVDMGEEALQLYTRMQQEGVIPDERTYITALKACSNMAESGQSNESSDIAVRERCLECLETVRAIHGDIVMRKFESNVFVGTMLVDVYAKCRSLEDAKRVFEKMRNRTAVSWNAMIFGYAQMGKGEEGLQLYTRMQQEGVVADARTFVSTLKACSTLAEKNDGDVIALRENCLKTVRAIHGDIAVGKFESDAFVGTMLVDVYAKCGSLEEAKRVFEKMPNRTVVSWNVMMLGYAQLDKGLDALQLYTRMQQEGVTPNARTYVSALKACSTMAESGDPNEVNGVPVKVRCLNTVRAIHKHILEGKLEEDVFVGNMLLDAYARCGSLHNARQVFERMPHRNVVSWNAMIFGYVQMDKGEEALQLYIRMQMEGVMPNGRTYVSALKACNSLADLENENKEDGVATQERCLQSVRSIHKEIVKLKLDSDVFVGTMLVDVYAKCGSLGNARDVFEKMLNRTVVSWNALIFGYAQMGKGEEALQLFGQMQDEGVAPNGRTYASALKACTSLLEWTGRDDSNQSDALKERCLETVRAIHKQLVENKIELDVFVETMLVDAYAKCGSLEDARRVFQTMAHHDVVSWTSMISGYAQMDKGEEAFQLYTQMKQEGVVPDGRTYVAALQACGSVAGLEKGKEIHAHVVEAGLEANDVFVTDSLINMYAKCGSMADAQRVFDAMPTRGTVAWNALIAGYAHHGDSAVVLDLFQRMVQEAVKPDGITFLGVLTACSHAGLVDSGQMFFEAMSRDYGMTPTIKHFTCMVDILGRAGHLDKATKMVKAMPLQPHGALWRCILGACRKWGEVELGRQAFEHAVQLNKDDAAAYVLMSNIYAAAHMRDEANEVQGIRMKIGAWKEPGQSRWMDMNGVAHVFMVGDRGHPESQKIYTKLSDLLVKMKKLGYEPHLESVLRDIPDEEKLDALCGHSERLAIAYALLQTPEGTTIRVVKNLRVCEDCHRATALISIIEQRTIICRDATRFHVFKGGKCSCGDYW